MLYFDDILMGGAWTIGVAVAAAAAAAAAAALGGNLNADRKAIF